jgi:hypothetical protein
MRLRGLVRRLLVHLVPIKPIAVLQEDVCWCGIHHLGRGYVHHLPALVTFQQCGMTGEQMQVATPQLDRMRVLGFNDQDAAELLAAAAAMFGTDGITMAASYARLVQAATDRSYTS